MVCTYCLQLYWPPRERPNLCEENQAQGKWSFLSFGPFSKSTRIHREPSIDREKYSSSGTNNYRLVALANHNTSHRTTGSREPTHRFTALSQSNYYLGFTGRKQ